MEIAFFSESYVPIRDGVAQQVHSLARRFQRMGHGVRVYTPSSTPGEPKTHTEVDGVPVVRVRSLPIPFYREYRWGLFPMKDLRGEGFRDEVDVIHLHTPGILGSTGFLAARYFRKPLVGTFHTNVWEMRSSFPQSLPIRMFFRAARWYGQGLYFRCDIATAPTEEGRRALLVRARKPFRREVQVVPNGIEIERFHPGIPVPDWRERCGLPSDPVVTFMGRLTADKGIHRFLDALSDLAPRRPFSAIIAGVGPEEANVRARLRTDPQLAGRVRYIGPVAEEEKAALLAQSELFVLPSTSDTSSVALLEAMACGAACVASDQGGPRDLIENDVNGRLVSVEAPGALSAAISDLLDDPAARGRIRGAAIEHVRRTASIDATARKFISLYEQLITEKGAHVTRNPG